MDKNTITGIVLIALLFIGFTWWSQPSEEEIKAQQEQLAQQEAAKDKAAKAEKDAVKAQRERALQQTLEDSTALLHRALKGTAQRGVL